MKVNIIIKNLILFCISMLLIVSPVSCFAMNTGFEIENKTEEETDSIREQLNIKMIDEPKNITGFSCFDVKKNGNYILGIDRSNNDLILVYDSAGKYNYGFSIADNGSFGLEWDNKNINIYFVRSNLAIQIDNQGNVLDIKEIVYTEKNDDYWFQEIYANKRIVNDTEFTAEHWLYNSELLHWGSYSNLVKTASNGERQILFEAESAPISLILPIAILILFALVSVSIIVIKLKITKNGKNHTGDGSLC